MFKLDDAYKAIDGRKEFVAKQAGDAVVFDYVITTPDSFEPSKSEIATLGPDAARRSAFMRRNFRGITFDRRSGELLSLPLHKFFNVNQNEESRFDLHRDKAATIYEKLDGSMIHFYRIDGRLVSSTCRSPDSEQAIAAMTLAKDKRLTDRIGRSIDRRLTPVFELCAPWNQIVVRYEEPRLVYLVSRSMDTGAYVSEDGYEDRARTFDFRFSEVMGMLDGENHEGYICHLDDGCILKVKTPWYMAKHRSVDLFMKPAYFVYEAALDGVMDDIISSCPENYRQRLREVWREADEDFLTLKKSIEEANRLITDRVMSKHGGLDRKTIVEEVRASDPGNFAEHMVLLNGKSLDEMLKKRLMEGYRAKYREKFYSPSSD